MSGMSQSIDVKTVIVTTSKGIRKLCHLNSTVKRILSRPDTYMGT